MEGLSESGLDERLIKAAEAMAFTQLTAVQEAVFPVVLAGKDLVASSSTGSGKTAAFLFPILQRFIREPAPNSGTRALILLPTRELALQTQKNFQKIAAFTQFKSGLVIGGEPFKYQISTIRRNPEVIIATPGRLVEHLERKNIDFDDLEFLVLDEADMMLDMGFAEDLMAISSACNEQRQNLLFSATLNHKAFRRIRSQFKEPEYINVESRSAINDAITQQCILADDDRHKEKVIAKLIELETPERCFVFCRTRLQVQKLSNMLRAAKIRSEYIHGELSQSDRKQVLNRFRDGKLQVLVATDLAARGLDVSGVDLVINFTVAGSGDEHLHRIGRTGRAGSEGLAVSLVDAKEWNKMSSILRYLKVPQTWRKLDGLEADYKGPKKIKSSGKAAGSKKKKSKTTARKKAAPKTPSNQAPRNKSPQNSAPQNNAPQKKKVGDSAAKGLRAKRFGSGEVPLRKK